MTRRNIARLKKGKHTTLNTRLKIINEYGLGSREITSKYRFKLISLLICVSAVDEQINSMAKLYTNDIKRMKTNIKGVVAAKGYHPKSD